MGLLEEMTLDSRERPIPAKGASPKLGTAVRTLAALAKRIAFKSNYCLDYLRFLRTCFEHRDLQSAIAVPVIVASWNDFARARFNPDDKAGKVAANLAAYVATARDGSPNRN